MDSSVELRALTYRCDILWLRAIRRQIDPSRLDNEALIAGGGGGGVSLKLLRDATSSKKQSFRVVSILDARLSLGAMSRYHLSPDNLSIIVARNEIHNLLAPSVKAGDVRRRL